MNKIQTSSKEVPVLRVNCIESTPSAIEHIFTVESATLLALCRSDNSIELWDSKEWIQLMKIPGIASLQTRRVFLILTSTESITLMKRIRLFSCGLNGYLIEWDLLRLKPKFSYKNPGGCIWDAQMKGNMCLLGTNDGSSRVVKLKEGVDPYLLKQFPKTDSRILSVCWEDSAFNFYTGHSNGTIMRWSYDTLQVLLTLSVNNKDVLIWSLCSVDSHLLCGDSTGRLLVYDVTFGVLVKEFKEHCADIMSIVRNSSAESPCVYFTGIDSLVCSIQLNPSTKEWLMTSSFRGQSHDVNTLAMLNDNFLLSGGITTDICIYRIINGCLYQKYDKRTSTSVKRHISPFDQRAKYSISYVNDKTILILHQLTDSCDLWLVNSTRTVLLAKIRRTSSNDYHLLSSKINQNGNQIALSYDDKTVLFDYDFSNNEVKKVTSFKFQSNFIFFNESELICLSQSSRCIYLCDRTSIRETVKIEKSQLILACQYDYTMSLLAFSTLDKEVFIVNLQSKAKEPKAITSVPHPDRLITQIKFIGKEEVLLISDENRLYIVNTATNRFNQWTEQRIELNDYPLNYLAWYNKIFGCTVINETTVLLYTDYNYIKVDFSKELPKECIIDRQKMEKYLNSDWDKQVREYHRLLFDNEYKANRNKASLANALFGEGSASKATDLRIENNNFKIVSRYNSIMLMEMMPNHQLLVIENDWSRIIKTFPGSVLGKKYGH